MLEAGPSVARIFNIVLTSFSIQIDTGDKKKLNETKHKNLSKILKTNENQLKNPIIADEKKIEIEPELYEDPFVLLGVGSSTFFLNLFNGFPL